MWGAAPNRFLVEETEGMAPGRALDLACGEGRNAVWLAGRGWDVTGADFSPVALRTAARMAEERGVRVTWVEADATAGTPGEGFDLVAVLYLQLPDDRLGAALRGAAAALTPGGTLLVVSHDLTNIAEGHGGPQRPEVLTTPQAVVGHLGGLAVERAERVLRPVEGAPRPAIDTLVRARRPE